MMGNTSNKQTETKTKITTQEKYKGFNASRCWVETMAPPSPEY
jgi:hypothetical protein